MGCLLTKHEDDCLLTWKGQLRGRGKGIMFCILEDSRAQLRIYNYLSSFIIFYLILVRLQVHFVVIIMPMQKDDVYAAIKRYCISQTAIPSQCIVSKTLGNEKRMRSIVLKIALQINCKLGGSLWALKIPMVSSLSTKL